MKYRKDITEYLVSQDCNRFKNKEFRIYEQNGLLYGARYNWGSRKINFYTSYGLLWHEADQEIKQNIIQTFNVKFAESRYDLVCRCGETEHFSSHSSRYDTYLRCNVCKNNFTVHSG